MLYYASFGQNHTHRINSITYDCDGLMAVEAPDENSARRAIYNLTGGKWCGTYPEDMLPEVLKYFPRGVLNASTPFFAQDHLPPVQP